LKLRLSQEFHEKDTKTKRKGTGEKKKTKKKTVRWRLVRKGAGESLLKKTSVVRHNIRRGWRMSR